MDSPVKPWNDEEGPGNDEEGRGMTNGEKLPARKTKIEKLVSGGHGLGRVDGRVILVPYAAPGDEVSIEVTPSRKGVTWGSIKQILSPAPSRANPFCTHYGECGGCQLQHIEYPAQLEYKRLIVDDALRRIAGVRDADVKPCVGSPAQTAYRSRVRLHCDRGKIGFHKNRSNTIHPLESCPVLTDNINICLKQLSSHLSHHPIKGLSEIQMTESDSGVVLLLEMDSAPGAGVIHRLQNEVTASGAVATVGSRIKKLWGDGHSTTEVEGKKFRISPGAFFQANKSLLPALIHEILGVVKTGNIEAVELYAGVGLFSILLSEKVKRLVAVEWNRDAAEDASANLIANQIKNVEVLPASAEDALDLLLSRDAKPELIVMDPPREGLSTAARDKLIQMSPEQLIYVSCDPATLARDLKFILAAGEYRLEKITPLDMFPHTSHIECVCSIVRA